MVIHLSPSILKFLSLFGPPASNSKTLGALAEPAKRAATAQPEGPPPTTIKSNFSLFRMYVVIRSAKDKYCDRTSLEDKIERHRGHVSYIDETQQECINSMSSQC